MLFRSLKRDFYDSDEKVVEKTGKSPKEIIETEGEKSFRKIETSILKEITKESGKVIATGGGCVTIEENYRYIRQNSVVISLERDISKLEIKNRPLSKDIDTLKKLYEIRLPMYNHFKDYKVDNSGSVEDTVKQILEILNYENTCD